MTLGTGTGKPPRFRKPAWFLFLSILLGLIVLGPLETVVAELDEPPAVTRGAGWSEEEVLTVDRLRRGVLLSVSWILLLVGLLLVGLTLRKTYVWLRSVQRARVPPTRYFNLQVQVRDRNGELGLYNFDYYPVVVAATGSPDLLLPGIPDNGARFRIDYRENRALLHSDSGIIVNGVPRQQKFLKQDDRIIFGPYRLMFKDASIREQAPPIPGRPVFVWQFPVVAVLLALSILFRQSGVVREDRMLLAKASELQGIEIESADTVQPSPGEAGPPAADSTKMTVPAAESSAGQPPPVTETASGQQMPVREPVPASEPPPETTAEVPVPRVVDVGSFSGERLTPAGQRAVQEPRMLQASVLGAIAPSAIRDNGINPLEGLSIAKPETAPEIGRVKVRVVPPGRPVEYFKADILFIHAHPDDESIDFGSLMAMASRGKRRIVTLLFTDGESGLDLYPQRKVGDIYPARALTGGALSQVRVVEATRALSVLGAEMYIRWGLTNRPYNTKADEVSPDEVIHTWGGEQTLVRRLIEVLEGFRPSIVVSPDRKSGAYEHFEHEAVGQVVQTALERLRGRGGGTYVRAHLVSVDPYQVDRYDGVLNVNARARDEVSGLAYRSIQAAALKEHVTQRDASVIGVSRLSHLDEEYYKPVYWDLELSFQELLEQISR